ncbi:hypothetical protein DNTS_015631 [Danionella cerebrum]|uniref:Calponin-homology (CH) domain-containing protein n=1 Tax=Danionella cerebrum TaxID=2873325 RepID=A0A553QKF2_9TELE|nr:hypothetical protein DNTS_015631 [Danionella translucida]
MSGQRITRERGRGTFQHRTNIEKALAFLKKRSIKLVNINVSDIMDGKPSIILGLIWTIIMHIHIEELASTLSFSSRQSSLESLASLDSRSTSSSARSSPVPCRGSPLHARFRVSAKKALLLWVREQCQRAGCTLNVKDFKLSWRSGVVFLAILQALRPNVVDLIKARTRTNRQNLEEAFHVAERELHVPRLLDPADVDVRDPDEKSIMTYVAQFLQYSKDASVSDEEMQRLSPVNIPSDFTPSIGASPLRQTSANQKAQEVTCWLEQAYQELIEGWDSTEGESYAERYQVFHTFIVSFNEQRRPVMPLLTAMKRTPQLSAEQRALRQAWDSLAEKLREYKTELDMSLPSPLNTVGRWLLRIEEVLSAEERDLTDHSRAVEETREKIETLKVCLEEMAHHVKKFNTFQNTNDFGETLVPVDKMEEIKRRFTSVRVTAKYHGIKLEYCERRHAVLDLLSQLNVKLHAWKRPYISQEAVRVLMQDWNETVNKQELTSLLEGALHKLKQTASKYTSKAALAGDSIRVNHQVGELEAEVTTTLEALRTVRATMGRVVTAWDNYSDMYTSLCAWLEQGPHGQRHGQSTEVTLSVMSEWSSRHAHLNDVAIYLLEVTDSQTSRAISDELCKINLLWADFAKTAQFSLAEESSVVLSSPQTVQALMREATQLLKEPVEVISGSLRTYTKRLQIMMKKLKDLDLDALSTSECHAETLNKLQQAIPEVMQTLCEAEQVCDQLRMSLSGLDGRLAELLHWEIEAREMYHLLKEEKHRQKRGQDPRARLLISRGLQLEGQVVMEEQDLQVMVMSFQKISPLQYLIASPMQDRVRTAVEKSQEAVGLLSSLGSCMDRSPSRDQPHTKICVQYQEEGKESESLKETLRISQSETLPAVRAKDQSQKPSEVSSQAPKTQQSTQPVPMIVIQQYEEKEFSPQPEMLPFAVKDSQSVSHKSQKVSETQSKRGTLKGQYVESQMTSEHMVQEQAENQCQVQGPIPRQSSQILQREASQAQSEQDLLTQSSGQFQEQEKTQIQAQSRSQCQSETQKDETGQHQASKQRRKGKKSKANLQNRPWLQQKGQLENVSQTKEVILKVEPKQEDKSETLGLDQCNVVQPKNIVESDEKGLKQGFPYEKVVKRPQPEPEVQAQAVTQTQPQQSDVSAQPPPTQSSQPHPTLMIHQQKQLHNQTVTPQQPHETILTQTHPKSITSIPQQEMAHRPSHPGVSLQRFPVSQALHQDVFRTAQPYPTTPMHSQMVLQGQQSAHGTVQNYPHLPKLYSPRQIVPQPKGSSPIQPRIISMPQPQLPFQSQTQIKAQDTTPFMFQPQGQPQWSSPGEILQANPNVQGPTPSQIQPHFQTHPQPQSLPPPQHQQWSPIRPGIVTGSYPSVQVSGQVDPSQHQMANQPPPNQLHWSSVRPESPWGQSQTQPQGPFPSHNWRPVSPERGYPKPENQCLGVRPQPQFQSLPRPQSPQKQWGPVQSGHQVQVSSQSLSQPVTPWNHPMRPQTPQQLQQKSVSSRTEAAFHQGLSQSQTAQAPLQTQDLKRADLQEQPQQELTSVVKQPVLAQAPPKAYSEAYVKAQALVRNRFEEAKHCLQEHILEAISVFKDKGMTDEQESVKEESLRSLDPELLEEFLRAAEGMEAFCTPSELRDMEFFTQSVRTQWKGCFSTEGSLAEAGKQLEALKELCDTLSPEDAHRLAQAQLRECERRLAAIQRQFSGDGDTPVTDPGPQMEQTKEPQTQKVPSVSPTERPTEAVGPVSPQRPRTVEKREIVKQTSTEEDRYRSSRFALQAQLNRNEQCMLGDRPSESVSPTDLQKRLRELKSLWDETESLWKEYEMLCIQCVQYNERGVEQDRMELTVRWREQRTQLQGRVDSLGSALELMDSIKLKISEISERLEKFIKEPKDIKGYALVNPAILRDVKDLDESIQTEMDRLSRFDSEPSHLDLRDRSPLTQVVLKHRSSLDRLRQQVRKSDAAARALDRFLMSLRTVELDVSSVLSAPSSESLVLQDSRSKLTLIRKGVSSLQDKAPQLDQLLGGAQLEVTQDKSPISCLDMVSVLVRRVEEVDDHLMIRQSEIQQEQHNKGFGVRRKNLQAELRKVLGTAEKQGLKDPTMPAVQHRIRALSDLESQLNSLRPEYQSIRKAMSEDSENSDTGEEELGFLWDETERAITDRLDQCNVLLDLLKKFQSCRSYIGNTLQRAEQTINEQASYMGKENLQRLIAKVIDIKEDLSGLGPKMEEFRSVCRLLQSQLKTIPDCSEIPFETEADALVDTWLDVSEKTDSYLDNLRVGLELWEKQLVLGGEVDSWASDKLMNFSESHPFNSEEDVLSMKNEIESQEDNLENFHRKLLEIQELLQSKESPLELQVMETNLSKKMEQVKELFTDCTDVFKEVLKVKSHLIEKIDSYQSSVENIRSMVDVVSSDDRTQLEAHLQDLCEQLLEQENQAESLLKEINLMSSITGPQVLDELTNHSKRLKNIISETQEMIRQKKEQKQKSFLQTLKEEFQSFEEWLQDEQLSVNECFENPERKQDVEISMQRLTCFLDSREGEQHLTQLKERFMSSGQLKVSSEAQALFSTWHQEQEGELATLKAHCQGRHKQLDDIIQNFNCLQEEHDHLKDWLQQREQVPELREKLRQIQEQFLKESVRVEAFRDILSSIRMRGLRGDALLKDSETLIDQYHSLGILLENQAQMHKTLDDQIESIQSTAEQIRAWIRGLKRGLDSVGADATAQEKNNNAQGVLDQHSNGDGKLAALKDELVALCSHEILEDTRRQELMRTHTIIESEWKRVLNLAQQLKQQADVQGTLCKELENLQAQEESTKIWLREKLQILQSLGKEQPHEKLNTIQAVLDLKEEADSKLASFQRHGQSLCSYKELEIGKRTHIEQTQREMVEEWRKMLEFALGLKSQAMHEESINRDLQNFYDQGEDTRSWIGQLREILDALPGMSSFQECLNGAERSEGDCKLADLQMMGESLCSCGDMEEDKRQTIHQILLDLQQEWSRVKMNAHEMKIRSELEISLHKDLHDLKEHMDNTQSWIHDQRLKIQLLREDTILQERMSGAQAILNSESEGEHKLSTLRRKTEDLCSREGLKEDRKQQIQLNLRSIKDEWIRILESAQEIKKQAELQDSFAKELEKFYSQEESTCSWVKSQKEVLDSLGKNIHGTQDQIEERLSKVQTLASLHSEANSKITALKRTMEHLCNSKDADDDTMHSLGIKIKTVEEEWTATLQQAQEVQSFLRGTVERLVSCQCQKEQLRSRLEQVKEQTASLPHRFPWPGLGDRRHTVEQAKSLLDRTRALNPSLSAVRALCREMSQLTRDSSWIDPSWATMEECIPEIVKELTEFCVNLEEEIQKERACAQLVEQHSVAQDWLRDQVKGFGALPTERHGLQGAVNTLKALLQTVDREKREMEELDAVKESLKNICTPEGWDALTLEVSHLHDLCLTSEKEMRERLAVCEARLRDVDCRLSGQAQILREQAQDLLNDLRAQDHILGFPVGSQNISLLQESWHSFKTCEHDLEGLEAKVRDLGHALRTVPANEEPPSDVISVVDTVTQQYCSLRSKLSERQNDCADSTVQCVRQALQNIQSWNQATDANPPPCSASSMQAAIEEGTKLHKSLQVALSHKELLRDCLGPDLAGKLERDGLKNLKDAEINLNHLKQELENVVEKVKQEVQSFPFEAETIQTVSLDSNATLPMEFEQLGFVPSTFITQSCKITNEIVQEEVLPIENPESQIHLRSMPETTREIDVQTSKKSTSILQTVIDQSDITFNKSGVPSVSHVEIGATIDDLVSVALETKANEESSSSKPPHNLATEPEIDNQGFKICSNLSTKGKDFTSENSSSPSFDYAVQGDGVEVVIAESYKKEEDLFIPHSHEEFRGECEAQTKKIAMLILDVDNVQIRHMETFRDGTTVTNESASTSTLYQSLERQEEESTSSLPGQSRIVSDGASEVIAAFSSDNGPNAAIADSDWTVDVGPRDNQCRYIILDLHEEVRYDKTLEGVASGTIETSRDIESEVDQTVQTRHFGEAMQSVVKEDTRKTPFAGSPLIGIHPKFVPPGGESSLVGDSKMLKNKPEAQLASEFLSEESPPLFGGKAQLTEPEPKPTPPVRRRNGKSEVQSNWDKSSVLERKPVIEETMEVIVQHETKRTSSHYEYTGECEPRPTPPVRQRSKNTLDVQQTSVSTSEWIHESFETITPKPTPPVRRRKDGEIEAQCYMEDITPTPPTRQHKADTLSLNLELDVQEAVLPTPPSRRRREKLGNERFSLDLESQPTPPARRRKEKEDRRLSLQVEIQPTPPARRRKERERLSCDLETQPTPPLRRHKHKVDSDLLSQSDIMKTADYTEKNPVKLTPPLRRKPSQLEEDVAMVVGGEKEDGVTNVKPTPPTRRKDSKAEMDKPTPRRKDSGAEVDTLSTSPVIKPEGLLPTPPTRRKKSQPDVEKLHFMAEEPLVMTSPSSSHQESSTDEKLSLCTKLEAHNVPITKEKDEVAIPSFGYMEQEERTEDSLYFEATIVISQAERVQDKSVEVSSQESLSTEGTESPTEEVNELMGPTMLDTFTEIQKMIENGPNSKLIEGLPHENTEKLLNTTCTDLEARLKRLVFLLLDLRTCPATLSSSNMEKQLEEAEECRRSAQIQVSMISRKDRANGDISTGTNGTAYDTDALQQLRAQWNAALWDAASSVHSKEAQLQMVVDFNKQTQKVKATLERLRTDCETLTTSPSTSSLAEEERLRSFLRNIELERIVLGELIQMHAKLSPHLSPPERQAAEIQQSNLQNQWSVLEKDAEISLYKVVAFAKENSSLLLEISELNDQLKDTQKLLDMKKSQAVLWDAKGAEEIMNINADLTSNHQQYLYLQQTSEVLARGFELKPETCRIEQDLQGIKDRLDQIREQLVIVTPSSSNPVLSKIVKVMTDALAWAKQTECDVKGRQKKVSLLPEDVHRQIKDLKKLQSEMSSKQSQLKALVEEVTELMGHLGSADLSMVNSALVTLENLSKSTEGKLNEAVREIELGLQTREKLSEQIADVDSWVVGHLRKEALRREDYQSLSMAELDRRLRQIQDTLGEAEKQSAVTEALLMKSRDIASELSVLESTQLHEKLTNLQEDLKSIVIYEKACCQKVTEVLQGQECSQRKVSSLENSLRQMLVDVNKHRFPVTKDSLSAIEPFKQMIMERKSQVEQVSPCAEDKRRELISVIAELHHKIVDLELKAQTHERYLGLIKFVEDSKQEIEAQIPKTKDTGLDIDERYRVCQSLLIQLPLLKLLCDETRDELHGIMTDLYPSQLSAEETRLKEILESLSTSELMVNNNLQILEWDLLKDIHYPSEMTVFKQFLEDTSVELEKPSMIDPKEKLIEKQLRKCIVLRKNVESQTRILEFLEKRVESQHLQDSEQLFNLKDVVLEKCDQQIVNLTQAKELLRNYSNAVMGTIRFLQRAESALLPSVCSARSCSERLKDAQQALLNLDTEFQSHISQLQTQTPKHSCFKPEQVEFLHSEVLGKLLVKQATLKAQAQIQLESLKRCVDNQKHSRKCYEELCQRVRDSETLLSQCASKKITSHKDCKDQQQSLKALMEDVAMLTEKLENLREWCSLYGCRELREDAVSAIWGQVARLQRCANDLHTRSEQMEAEWSNVMMSLAQAASMMEQVSAELPDSSRENITSDELQDLLLFWSQFQDRLDCEQRALSSFELRTARLLGIPAHLEQAPPIEMCQQLRLLQERYHSLKEQSSRGQRAVRTEVEQRERVSENLEGVKEWLESAVSLLSVLENEPSKKQLQTLHSQLCTQKAVLQRISESLKMMYSDKNTSIPEEIEVLLLEASQSIQAVEEQVKSAVEKSGPLHRLSAKISEIKAGLGSVQSWLEQKSINFTEAESTQKRVWDELDGLHTRLTAVEVELQDVCEIHSDESQPIVDILAGTQQIHTHLTKQAEQRTAFLSKVKDWLQEHEEMVKGSQNWISEAQSWLTTPCTYTTARCLDSHVNALQMVLDDSAQMRRTLQGFGGTLTEMGSVFDITPLEEQLSNADRRVSDMQHSLLGPLSQLEHAAAEVDAIESEVKVMEKDIAQIKSALTIKEDISLDSLKVTEDRIELMKRTVAEMQKCKEGLCLPEKAENTLLVFKKAELLEKQLLELEQLTLEYSMEVQETPATLPSATSLNAPPISVPPTITEEEPQENGQIQIVHVEEDVLKKSGATLMTVEQSTAEQRLSWISLRSSHPQTETQVEVESCGTSGEASSEVDAEESQSLAADMQGAWMGPHNSATQTNTLSETQAPPTETLAISPEVTTSEKRVGGALEQPVGGAKEPTVTHLDETHTSSNTREQSDTWDTHFTARAHLERTVSTSLEVDAGGLECLSTNGLLQACHERAEMLAVCLDRAQVSLEQGKEKEQDRAMQQNIQQQLHNCQSSLVDIEQRISDLPVCGLKEQEQTEAESLNSKLQLLKKRLLTVQLQLQEKHADQQSSDESQRPLKARLSRSLSAQEMLSSSRTKLFRQSSLQQQKKLEHGLNEQKDLTKAIAFQGSRARTQGKNENPGKWTHLSSRLNKALDSEKDEDKDQEESEIPTPSVHLWDGAAAALCQQEIQSSVSRLKKLQSSAATQHPQVLDEGLFEVLSGVNLTLSSLSHTLVFHPGGSQSDALNQLQQLKSLAAELSSLSSTLTSQGLEVIKLLSSGSAFSEASSCFDLLTQSLCDIQKTLAEKQEQLQEKINLLQAHGGQKQGVKEIKRELKKLRDETEMKDQPPSLTQQITTLEVVLESVWGDLEQHCGVVQWSLDQQQMSETLLKGLQMLLYLAKDKLAFISKLELRNTSQLQILLNTHTSFFLSLGIHLRRMQQLSVRMPHSTPSAWETQRSEVESDVYSVLQQAQAVGARLQSLMQV